MWEVEELSSRKHEVQVTSMLVTGEDWQKGRVCLGINKYTELSVHRSLLI
jgi:hypothetical protein